MASVRPIIQFLVRIPNSSPTTIMMIARVRQNRICTSGGRSRTLTRGWPSRAGAGGRWPPTLFPNGPGLLSGVGSTGRADDAVGRFHDPPTGIGSAGPGATASPSAAAWPPAGERCGGRKSRIGSESAGTSVVAMSPKIEMPSSAGAGLGPGSAVSAVSGEDAEVDDGLGGASSTPECAYLIGPRRRLALRSCRGDRASWAGFSATAYVVPATPVLWLLRGGGSASAAGVTVACTPVCGCVSGCADDLELLIRGQAIHLTISAYRFGRL